VIVAKVPVALLAGLIPFVLLFPASASKDAPPECYSLLGYYNVPCDARVAWAAGAAMAGLAGLALWLRERRGKASG
jgi:hypothetical protein